MTDAPIADPPALGTADDAPAAPCAPSAAETPSTSAAPGSPDRAHRLALLGILALVVASWIIVPLAVFEESSRLDFGFTQSNVIYLVANIGISATILLAAGAVTLGSRGLLTAATALGGLNLLAQLGILVVQLVEGARPVLIQSTLVSSGVLALVVTGLVVGWAGLRGPTTARVGALVLVAAAALALATVPYLYSRHLDNLPLVAVVYSIAGGVLGVVAAGLLGLPNAKTRWVAVGLLAYFVAAGIFGLTQLGYYFPDHLHVVVVQVLNTLLYVVALVLAILAARRLRPSSPSPAPRRRS
ncbi:hypothetical protein [Antribacter gilvus]|uniref:hypothetical protein n=1 Tax=Antribacter gilvus TaxID=2304675 RepID=UPI000F7A3E97|nr:hypothetical protein [Antribacter gilvus]